MFCFFNCKILADYIDAAVSAISTASSGSADVLMSLNLLGPKAAFFMKALVPVGSVVVGELNPEVSIKVGVLFKS
jgi:hypothetical protein